jgi:hypothetical protein
MSENEVLALSFPVRWGPTYDPEMILEHAICHLLRHRRQLERWVSRSIYRLLCLFDGLPTCFLTAPFSR